MALRHGGGIAAAACPHGLSYRQRNPSNCLGLRLSSPEVHSHHIPPPPPGPGASRRRFPLALAVRRSELGGGNTNGGGGDDDDDEEEEEEKKKKAHQNDSSSSGLTARDKIRVVAEEKGKGDVAKDGDAPTSSKQQQGPSVSLTLDDVNPVGLGRKSRQIFDEVWRKFSGLGQISRTPTADDRLLDAVLIRGPMCEFTIPGAQETTVLVVGATSRIGRIVVRKLMLRGYKVKVGDSVSGSQFRRDTIPFFSCVLISGG